MRLIELELLALAPVLMEAPIKEKKRPEASPLDSLQELFRNDLVGVHVGSAHGRDAASMSDKCLHEIRNRYAFGCSFGFITYFMTNK
jgi:hypothetical protein